MPLYDYKCREHGVFHQLATMARSAEPAPCPSCEQLSPRIIMLLPEVLARGRELAQARDRNERSQHEPMFSTVESRQEDQARLEHKHGEGCCNDRRLGKSMMFYTADGKKMFPSMRPWMISH